MRGGGAYVFAQDVTDEEFARRYRDKGNSYSAFVIVTVLFLFISTVLALIPIMCADCKAHFVRSAGTQCIFPWRYMGCTLPCLQGKKIKDVKLSPINYFRLNLFMLAVLDVPQIISQIILCVTIQEVSYTAWFSFLMTVLNLMLSPLVVWKQIKAEDRTLERVVFTKSLAQNLRKKREQKKAMTL